MQKIVLSFLVLFVFVSYKENATTKRKNYTIDGSISKEVLINYLSRSVTFSGLSYSDTYEDDLRLIKNIHPKFVGRVSYVWNNETDFPGRAKGIITEPDEVFERAEKTAKDLHAIDPEIVLQACMFEIVDSLYVSKIKIPAKVFDEFGLKPENRNFNYSKMLYSDGLFYNYWAKSQSVPDLSKQETQLFWFFLGSKYIDLGYEALHTGQVNLMNRADNDGELLFNMLGRLRDYAKKYGRRHIVMFDAHTHGNISKDGRLLFDFHSFPQRPKEVCEKPYQCILEVGYKDGNSIYKNSKGGITPSGWECESLPYIVEFDNSGIDWDHQGQCDHPTWYWPWGWEESAWFTHCSPEYRAEWLKYVVQWLQKNDPVGFLQMPVKITTEAREQDGLRIWYRANNKSEACPLGYSDEEGIKSAWKLLE